MSMAANVRSAGEQMKSGLWLDLDAVEVGDAGAGRRQNICRRQSFGSDKVRYRGPYLSVTASVDPVPSANRGGPLETKRTVRKSFSGNPEIGLESAGTVCCPCLDFEE